MAELLLQSFFLRVVIPGLVVEDPVFLCTEKTEIHKNAVLSLPVPGNYHTKIAIFSPVRDFNANFMKIFGVMDIRIGNGYDVHALAEGLPLWLGGVQIESELGCIAHSDGDVAIHALCDALLGALALGDIGKHFPDTSDEFKGIDSKILLHRTMELVEKYGWRLGNADITIAMQRPKLAPYIIRMRETLAEVMGVPVSAVSVKATTTEKLGFVGRSEGCEVFATVLLFSRE